jgi:hypothetical protein
MKILIYTLLIIIATGVKVMANENQHFFKYLGGVEANNIICFATVNGMEATNNTSSKRGSFMTGFNATAFLEKGENEISLAAVSNKIYEKIYEIDDDSFCRLSLTANTPEEKYEMTSLWAGPDEKMRITGQKSKDYPAKHQTGSVTESQVKGSALYEMKRSIHIEHIPEWAWVKATPFENTPENYNELQAAYLEILELLKEKDIKGLQAKTELAMREWAQAEEETPETFFNSLPFHYRFAQGYKAVDADWGNYRFKSYVGGRLVQLEKKGGKSPLTLEKGDKYSSYNPFFSLINGRLVITR